MAVRRVSRNVRTTTNTTNTTSNSSSSSSSSSSTTTTTATTTTTTTSNTNIPAVYHCGTCGGSPFIKLSPALPPVTCSPLLREWHARNAVSMLPGVFLKTRPRSARCIMRSIEKADAKLWFGGWEDEEEEEDKDEEEKEEEEEEEEEEDPLYNASCCGLLVVVVGEVVLVEVEMRVEVEHQHCFVPRYEYTKGI
uniref:Uncharacterized protein n=1 Tax=Vespula pensylvanica TaxID=30213 RepID=A0A834U3M2_VESPE|nr:hypothetical protein H0235_011909 [Vespula pensylvanica]